MQPDVNRDFVPSFAEPFNGADVGLWRDRGVRSRLLLLGARFLCGHNCRLCASERHLQSTVVRVWQWFSFFDNDPRPKCRQRSRFLPIERHLRGMVPTCRCGQRRTDRARDLALHIHALRPPESMMRTPACTQRTTRESGSVMLLALFLI